MAVGDGADMVAEGETAVVVVEGVSTSSPSSSSDSSKKPSNRSVAPLTNTEKMLQS